MITIVGPGFELDPADPTHVDTTSRSRNWSRGLSPFLIGPCDLYPGAACAQSKNMENAWQYSKVYPDFLDKDGNPGVVYQDWARRGWLTARGIRYPMGKGAVPSYSFWDGRKLGYIEARKQIYIPLYSDAVQKTEAFEKLAGLYREHGKLVLRDFDGYDHRSLGLSLEQVIDNPAKKMGHAFVLAMLLEKLK